MVVMVLSLGFIASVFLLQYVSLTASTNIAVSLQNLQRNGLVNVSYHISCTRIDNNNRC